MQRHRLRDLDLRRLSGLALAYQFYIRKPPLPAALAQNQDFLYKFLLNKWYFDELYDLIFVRSATWLGYQLWKKGDEWFRIVQWGRLAIEYKVMTDPSSEEGVFHTVWKRQPDGSWKFVWD